MIPLVDKVTDVAVVCCNCFVVRAVVEPTAFFGVGGFGRGFVAVDCGGGRGGDLEAVAVAATLVVIAGEFIILLVRLVL